MYPCLLLLRIPLILQEVVYISRSPRLTATTTSILERRLLKRSMQMLYMKSSPQESMSEGLQLGVNKKKIKVMSRFAIGSDQATKTVVIKLCKILLVTSLHIRRVRRKLQGMTMATEYHLGVLRNGNFRGI
jgi:hypothetical protein